MALNYVSIMIFQDESGRQAFVSLGHVEADVFGRSLIRFLSEMRCLLPGIESIEYSYAVFNNDESVTLGVDKDTERAKEITIATSRKQDDSEPAFDVEPKTIT